MKKYHLTESFLYEVYAKTKEEALELFQQYQEANTTEEEEAIEVEFLENFTDIEKAD
jgi:hypothetical protein